MEIQFLQFLQGMHSQVLDSFMIFITKLGNGGFIWILSGIIFFIQKDSAKKKTSFKIFLALIIFAIIGLLILKPLIARPRPCWLVNIDLLIKNPSDYSFPSGHTGSSFAAATVIYNYNKKLGLFSIFFASLIAFSRMYHFVHYPTDILGGLVLGVLCGIISITFAKSLELKLKSR